MIICLCKGISDRKIKEMAQEGQSLRQIVQTCEASTCCGACAQDVRQIVLRESKDQHPATTNRINPCS